MLLAFSVKFLTVFDYEIATQYIFVYWPLIYWANFVVFLWMMVASKHQNVHQIRQVEIIEDRMQRLYNGKFQVHVYLKKLVSYDYEVGVWEQNAQNGHFKTTDQAKFKDSLQRALMITNWALSKNSVAYYILCNPIQLLLVI